MVCDGGAAAYPPIPPQRALGGGGAATPPIFGDFRGFSVIFGILGGPRTPFSGFFGVSGGPKNAKIGGVSFLSPCWWGLLQLLYVHFNSVHTLSYAPLRSVLLCCSFSVFLFVIASFFLIGVYGSHLHLGARVGILDLVSRPKMFVMGGGKIGRKWGKSLSRAPVGARGGKKCQFLGFF